MNAAAARKEFLAVLRWHEPGPRHVLQVARLALHLFDGLALLHQLGNEKRRPVEAAACLHDIDWRLAPDRLSWCSTPVP